MSHWDAIRKRARNQRAAVLAEADGNPDANALLTASDRLTSFTRIGVHRGDALLDGGDAALDPEMECIWFCLDVAPHLAVFYQVHEYAHLWLHHEQSVCQESTMDNESSEDPVPLGLHMVEGYGPEERREQEANVFAREFLLPTDVLRQWFIAEGLNVTTIAARVGVSEGMILQQLARGLLTPESSDLAEEEPSGEVSERPLDPSQEAAAQALHGPLLLEAGPGTGKTRTLVGRIVCLLQRGVSPSTILALNRAANEMRERVARVEPAAAHIWLGTFHAFGLELFRKYGTRLGLPTRPVVLDPAAAVALLEEALPDLDLNHYQNLYDPAINLRDILSAISRAKDELISPDEYLALAQAMRDEASTQDEITNAERALEVAHIYVAYQAILDREHLLDFGDLIFKTVLLLRTQSDIADELRRTYTQILVDEYQDVNHASRMLLRELAGSGEGLWVVGDARQAIYRFRGAAPTNMRHFLHDYPGGTVLSLRQNYRSQPPIVNLFSQFASQMRVAQGGLPFTPWEADRVETGGQVLVKVADDIVAEADEIAYEIERQHASGIPYHEQAILCRTHTNLGRIAKHLEQVGVPVLYLGNLFERSEMRDVLSLLSFACAGDGRGLVRVARFPEYQIPLADVKMLRMLAHEQGVPFPRALTLAHELPTISTSGKRGLTLLDSHLQGICYGSHPWFMLATYLFNRSQYLRFLLDDETIAGQQRRLALYQFLQFAHEYQPAQRTNEHIDPKRQFLQYVRHLEMYGEEKQLRQVPPWAGGIDAVRLLTVHASKGLEFRVVYLPTLGQGIFPSRRQWQPCPPPPGMLANESNGHEEEEECLFFVGLSRARDTLCLSRARHYGNVNSRPSSLLEPIAQFLPMSPEDPPAWGTTASIAIQVQAEDPPSSSIIIEAKRLDLYIQCPRRYFYEFVMGLNGNREDSAYVQFHACVYRVLQWMADERTYERIVVVNMALVCLTEAWAEHGPRDHPYETLYWHNAEEMVTRAVNRPLRATGKATRPEWEVRLRHGSVQLTPDHVETLESGEEIVERLRTGRPSKRERDKGIYALYLTAVDKLVASAPRRVQIRYLSSGHIEPITMSQKSIDTHLQQYDSALAGILREEFPPQPNDRICPRCPHYFICPSAEDH